MGKLSDYVVFLDSKLAEKFSNDRIPIDTLWEAYFDGAVDIPGDIYRLLDDRHAVAKHPFTREHVKYFVTKFVPELVVHSRKIDEKLVRWHYDRGDDFFAAFLGPRMVYTSGFFTNVDQSVEQAQDQKLDLVCQKLMLQPGERLLDIGCGWGTLAMHAAKHYGVHSTGVTLSENQAAFATKRIQANGLTDKVKILCMDYREIPKAKYDKISNLEMVEHVGIKNLTPFYSQVYDLLEDNGLFLMQWTGLRRKSAQEDLVWGLFMAKYVFAGADASLPLSPDDGLHGEDELGDPLGREPDLSLPRDDPEVARQLDAEQGPDRQSLRRALVPHLARVPRLGDHDRGAGHGGLASRFSRTRT